MRVGIDTEILEDVSESEYHSDLRFGPPRLSKSRAHRLLARSPAHVFAEHPALNPEYVAPEAEPRFDLGNAVHALVLEKNEDILVRVERPDWKSKAAQEERAAARIEGKIPMLAEQHDRVLEMATAIWNQIPMFDCDPPLFSAPGQSEVTILWHENGVDWKARLDWLCIAKDKLVPHACHDLKTTKYSAAPEQWSRSMIGFGADMQSVIYRRGMKAVFGVDVPLTFAAVETYPPYAMSVHDLSPALVALAEQRVDFAASVWRQCLETKTWPAYPTQVCFAEPPGYAETNLYERMYRDEEPA